MVCRPRAPGAPLPDARDCSVFKRQPIILYPYIEHVRLPSNLLRSHPSVHQPLTIKHPAACPAVCFFSPLRTTPASMASSRSKSILDNLSFEQKREIAAIATGWQADRLADGGQHGGRPNGGGGRQRDGATLLAGPCRHHHGRSPCSLHRDGVGRARDRVPAAADRLGV